MALLFIWCLYDVFPLIVVVITFCWFQTIALYISHKSLYDGDTFYTCTYESSGHMIPSIPYSRCMSVFFRKLNSNSLRRSWVNYAFGASSVGVGMYQVPCAGFFPFEKYLKNRFLSFFVGTYTYCMESYVHRWIEHRSSSSTSFLLFFL